MVYFRQRLITSDAMEVHSHISQGNEEPAAHYLFRAKTLLEHIWHTTKLLSIAGVGWDNMYLVRGLRAPHIRRRVSSKPHEG